jgi:hypothetical protein
MPRRSAPRGVGSVNYHPDSYQRFTIFIQDIEAPFWNFPPTVAGFPLESILSTLVFISECIHITAIMPYHFIRRQKTIVYANLDMIAFVELYETVDPSSLEGLPGKIQTLKTPAPYLPRNFINNESRLPLRSIPATTPPHGGAFSIGVEKLPDIPLQASWLGVTPRSSGGTTDVHVSATIAEDDPPLPSRTEEIITLFRCAMDPPSVRKVPMTELVRAYGCLEDIQTMATKPCSDEIDELAPVLIETGDGIVICRDGIFEEMCFASIFCVKAVCRPN